MFDNRLVVVLVLTTAGCVAGGANEDAGGDSDNKSHNTGCPTALPACLGSNIEHVVLIVQENHTFDSYFGRYCQAPSGSNPTCTAGSTCCERAPDLDPSGAAPTVLDDTTNFAADHDHEQACELQEIDNGKMDRFVTGGTGADTCLGSGPSCSSATNWALAMSPTVGPYWSLAQQSALADRYFQPLAGGSSSNDMFFAVAQYQFTDNDQRPKAIGSSYGCPQGYCETGTPTSYPGRSTIADLLLAAGKTFAVYADGYRDAVAAAPSCESVPSDCPYSSITHPVAAQACKYDASDIPFTYYAQFADGPYIKDYRDLATDLSAGALPSFAYVKARSFHNEHPNVSTITDGVTFVTQTIAAIEQSAFAATTLVLLTWDEGGGFFDHVAPPPAGVDGQPYGTRVPLLAIGPFARTDTVSHVQLEHSSVVKFLEYNFIGPTGQLNARDAVVNNLGSLLDPAKTGIAIPD
jgi:phospholipase C